MQFKVEITCILREPWFFDCFLKHQHARFLFVLTDLSMVDGECGEILVVNIYDTGEAVNLIQVEFRFGTN